MSDLDNDPVVRRAIDELRRMPPVDASAMRRVVAAAAAARVAPADEPVPFASGRGNRRSVWAVVGIAAAAAIVGFMARGALTSRPSETAGQERTGAAAVTQTPMRAVATSDRESMAIPHQFVFENRDAHRIAVVGDFNKWNPASAPMTRSSDGMTWSTIVPILPGRHTFGFMVDDSVFTLDPRAPQVRDPELGAAGSVVIVGRP